MLELVCVVGLLTGLLQLWSLLRWQQAWEEQRELLARLSAEHVDLKESMQGLMLRFDVMAHRQDMLSTPRQVRL